MTQDEIPEALETMGDAMAADPDTDWTAAVDPNWVDQVLTRRPAGTPQSEEDQRERGTVTCHTCGELHEAMYSHVSKFGGHRVFEVVCPIDWLTDWYTEEVVNFP